VNSAGSDELNIAGAGVLPDEAQKAILDVARAPMNAHHPKHGSDSDLDK
jgi:hypothetical protein